MIPIRPRIYKRLAQFVRVIAIELPEAYGLVLRGSWANGEYHAVKDVEMIRSYSDVDFICDAPLSPNARMTIENTFYKAATSCGLELQGISIRPADEMRHMWTLQGRRHDQRESRECQSEFVQFWTLIGAAEVCAAWLLSQDSSPSKRYYHLNKFFLGIWCDLGLVYGHRLGSYLETLCFAARRLSVDICNASYALKLGFKTTMPWHTLQSVHQASILCELRRVLPNDDDYERVFSVIHDLTHLDSSTAGYWGAKILEFAKDFEGELPFRAAARNRLLQKLSRGYKADSIPRFLNSPDLGENLRVDEHDHRIVMKLGVSR